MKVVFRMVGKLSAARMTSILVLLSPSLLKASLLNHLFLPAICYTDTAKTSADSFNSRLLDLPPTAISVSRQNRGPLPFLHTHSLFAVCSFPPLLLPPERSELLYNFLTELVFSFSANPWSLIQYVLVCYCLKNWDFESTQAISHLFIVSSSCIHTPIHPLFCPHGVNFIWICLWTFICHPHTTFSPFCISVLPLFCSSTFLHSKSSVWHPLPAGCFLQAIKVMEVPVIKIRGGESGPEEKMMIKSIVNMVQYRVFLFVCLSTTLWWDLVDVLHECWFTKGSQLLILCPLMVNWFECEYQNIHLTLTLKRISTQMSMQVSW